MNKDFYCGYSPERINPGDTKHKISNIKKVVAADDKKTLNKVSAIYKKIIKAGIYKASSIKIAETSKAIENYFSHVLKGKVLSWCVPGINGINFLLKDSLGGGGMASMSIDPQGKSYAQQLLDYEIPVDDKLFSSLNKT